MNETKRDRFIRVMTNRVTKILEAVDQLSKCADHRSYDYTPDMVDRAFQQIVDQLGQVRSIFDTETGRKTFSLSNAGWYWISADNGNTWTKQILTTEEASEHLAEGYMLKKTEPLEEQPRIKVIAVYDKNSYDLTVYSTSPNLDFEIIDTGSADPSDDDYEEHDEEIQARIDELNAAVTRGELFCLACELAKRGDDDSSSPRQERSIYVLLCRKPRDINNMGDVPCPDAERCELCGNHNPDMQCLSVTLPRGGLKLIAKVMSAQTDPGLQALAEKISKAADKD